MRCVLQFWSYMKLLHVYLQALAHGSHLSSPNTANTTKKDLTSDQLMTLDSTIHTRHVAKATGLATHCYANGNKLGTCGGRYQSFCLDFFLPSHWETAYSWGIWQCQWLWSVALCCGMPATVGVHYSHEGEQHQCAATCVHRAGLFWNICVWPSSNLPCAAYRFQLCSGNKGYTLPYMHNSHQHIHDALTVVPTGK